MAMAIWRKILRWLSRRRLSDAIALLAILVSLWTWHQTRDRLDVVQRQNAAMTFRPRLTFLRTPKLGGYSMSLKGMSKPLSPHPVLLADMAVTYTVEVTNTGNAPARLLAQVSGDTLTGAAAMRNALKDPKKYPTPLKVVPSPEFYSFKEIQPSDTAAFTCRQPLTTSRDTMRVFHLLLLYENELGQIYDTYYWARYLESPLWFVRDSLAQRTDSAPVFTLKEEDLQRFLEIIDTNQSSEIYSPEEAKTIRALISEAP